MLAPAAHLLLKGLHSMPVRSAHKSIKEARIFSGLTQEELSDGICSPKSLGYIERGIQGVSPATFQALMERTNTFCERYPIFANRTDFECFYALKHISFYLDAWQLDEAYKALAEVEAMNWANNRYYYQEWLMYHCLLQFRSYKCNHQELYNHLLTALRVSRPDFTIDKASSYLLSNNELLLLILLMQESVYCGRLDNIPSYYEHISAYIEHREMTYLEKEHFQALAAVAYGKYLINSNAFSEAFNILDSARHNMAINQEIAVLYELTFLVGLCLLGMNNVEQAKKYIYTAIYSTHAMDCCYSTVCRNYITDNKLVVFNHYLSELPMVPLTAYEFPTEYDYRLLADGTFVLSSPDVYSLSNIIHDNRKRQHISQETLAYGLCSKGTLSKIENGYLLPNIALAEALLQRLGISERIFHFWGDEKDALFYDYKFHLIHANSKLHKDERAIYIDNLNQLVSQSDNLHRSLILNEMTQDSASSKQALSLIVPNFDIENITNYLLGWEEISTINIITKRLISENNIKEGINYIKHLMFYYTSHHYDIILSSTIYPMSLYALCNALYTANHFSEVIDISSTYDISYFKFNPKRYSFYLFFYAQSLGECHDYNKACLYGIYAYYLQMLYGFDLNSTLLQKYLVEDFKITVPTHHS